MHGERSRLQILLPLFVVLLFVYRPQLVCLYICVLFDWLPSGSGEICQSAPGREVRQGYVVHLPTTPVWIESHMLEVRHRAIFLRMVRRRDG